MKVIGSEVTFRAPPNTVWKELTSFSRYGDWNPFLPEVEADLIAGSSMRALSRLPIGLKLRFKGEILSVTPDTELIWRAHARMMPAAAFDVVHTFTLSEVDEGTKLVQREDVTGFVVPLSGWILSQAEKGQEQMNEALRGRVEG